jgi:ABC-2 type transport system permease protein
MSGAAPASSPSNVSYPVSAGRSIWLLTSLRLKRLANQTMAIYNRPLGGGKGRPATASKKRNRWVITGFVSLMMLFSYGNLTRQSIVNLHIALDSGTEQIDAARAPAQMLSGPLSDALTRGLTMEISLLLVAVVLLSLAARELSQPDWDLEWLVTLPVPTATLLWSRILERSIANPAGILTLWPAGILLAWMSGFRWGALPVGAIAISPLLLLAAVARTLVDTGLRLSLAPSRLRNLQAVLSVASVLLLYSVISLGLRSPLAFMLDWARGFPAWGCWLPAGLMIRAVNASNLSAQLEFGALLVVEAGILAWGGVEILKRQLANGVVGASSRETARRPAGRPHAAAAQPRDLAANPRFLFGTTVQRRELRLLSRDRSFLVQTLVLPVIIVLSQFIIQGRMHGLSLLGVSNTTIASVAFGIAAYTLMLSAFQTLNTEGGSLWLLYTVPRSLESILAEKARLWAALALIYPIGVFILAMTLRMRVDFELLELAAIVLLGVPIYTAIAVSLGVFGCDPLSQEVRTRLRPTYVYLYMMLAGLYTYAIFASAWWQKLVFIVLSALLAAALWQKARDELPYLLDPAASPPARVSTSDGVIAAMLFFVVQGIMALFLIGRGHHLSGSALITAYAVAGAMTYGIFRIIYRRSKTTGVPAIFGVGLGRGLGWGTAAGLAAAFGGVAYLFALQRLDLMQEVVNRSAVGLSLSIWIPVLAIAAAPLFEEFIFRGLIMGGLRRSLGAAASIVGSAAVFAIVHPPVSMIPVFGLGLCAGIAYERSKMLLAPMIAHSIYNAIVIAYQLHS